MDELIFAGNKYISSKRAEKLTGYTTDYLGQLCRADKIQCRLVGRNWYVNERGIEKYKKSFKKEQTPVSGQSRLSGHARAIEYEKIGPELLYYSNDKRSLNPEISKIVHKDPEEIEDNNIIEDEQEEKQVQSDSSEEDSSGQAVPVHTAERQVVNIRRYAPHPIQRQERQIMHRQPIVPQQINKGFPIAASIASILILIGILFTAGTFTLEQAIHYSSGDKTNIDTSFQFANVQEIFNFDLK